MLVDLGREDGVVRLGLGALTRDDIVEFVDMAAGGDLGPELRRLAARSPS